MTTVELVRFKVRPEQVEELLAARPDMLNDFAADRAGFLGARLVRLPNDEWLDIVDWAAPEDLAISRTKGPNLPGIARFFNAIDTIVVAEEGTLADI